MNNLVKYVICVVLVELSGFIVGMLMREGTKIYSESIVQPPLSPAPVVFPIAWTILYALMGIGIARVLMAEASGARTAAMGFFFAQLVFNLAWSFIFFGAQRFDLAFVWLVILFILALLMAVFFKRVDAVAMYMQIPYLIWLMFAGYLNLGVWVLNKAEL